MLPNIDIVAGSHPGSRKIGLQFSRENKQSHLFTNQPDKNLRKVRSRFSEVELIASSSSLEWGVLFRENSTSGRLCGLSVESC